MELPQLDKAGEGHIIERLLDMYSAYKRYKHKHFTAIVLGRQDTQELIQRWPCASIAESCARVKQEKGREQDGTLTV